MQIVDPVVAGQSRLVHVNRKAEPPLHEYPVSWFLETVHSNLACKGPWKYDLERQVRMWTHPNQVQGYVRGNTIYERLKKEGGISVSLNLQDALAIKLLPVELFLSVFGERKVFFWASVSLSIMGLMNVPFLVVEGREIKLRWRCLEKVWRSSDVALYFA